MANVVGFCCSPILFIHQCLQERDPIKRREIVFERRFGFAKVPNEPFGDPWDVTVHAEAYPETLSILRLEVVKTTKWFAMVSFDESSTDMVVAQNSTREL